MNLREVTDLITIRQYVVNATANFSIDRATVNDMNGILLMLDKKIIGILRNEEFKEYIEYKDVQKAKEDAARLNNIKSGLRK